MDDTSGDALSDLQRRAIRQQLLESQLQTGRSLFMRPAAQGYGTLGGIGAGLSNLGRGLFGGLMMRDAQQGLPENAASLGKDRSALLSAMMGPPPAAASAPGPAAPPPDSVPPFLARVPAPDMSGAPAAQPAAMGAVPAPDATPQPTGPAALAAIPKPDPMAGISALAALSMKDRQDAAKLISTGDPVLGAVGQSLLGKAQQEMMLDYQRTQAVAERENRLAIADKPQFHLNPYSQQAYVFEPDTERVRMVGGGGASVPGGGLGTSPRDMKVAEAIRQLGDRTNPEKVAPDLNRKLQFSQRLDNLLDQYLGGKSGKTPKQVATEIASSMASFLSNGGAPAEGMVRELLPPSFTGNLANLENFFTNDMNGADLSAWLKTLKSSLAREEPVVRQQISQLIQHNLDTTPKLQDAEFQKAYDTNITNLRQQRYLPGPNGSFTLEDNPQDSDAVAWAKANPKDPRAQRILQLNGVK